MNLRLLLLIATAAFALTACPAPTTPDPPPPAPSLLDPTFGSGGKVTTDKFGGKNSAMALQPDGKIVMVGGSSSDFVLARYNADGNLDTGFALGTGQALTDIGGTNQAFNLALQPDGKIVVSGSPIGVSASDNHTNIARYSASGSLDISFDTDGRLQLSDLRVGNGLAIQPDGKLVLVGNVETATPPATATQFAVMRLNADGSRDNAFGSASLVETAFAVRGDRARSVALQADGKIVVAGQSDDVLFALARYNADGTLDSSFRSSGKLTIQFGIQAGAENVVIQPDGKIVLGGFSESVSSVGYALARLIP